MTVKDTGTGIDKKNLGKIFDPFFTTKEEGKGTGLGLSTVFGIVKQNEGYIRVESERGRGTSFHIYLPVIEQTDFLHNEEVSSAGQLQGSECVLVVENERAVRSMICRTLRLYGYRIFEAADAELALDIYNSEHETIDLILTDVIMPGQSGVDLVAELRRKNSKLRVIYMSGYTKGKIQQANRLPEGINFIQKPFTSQAIAKAIRRALD